LKKKKRHTLLTSSKKVPRVAPEMRPLSEGIGKDGREERIAIRGGKKKRCGKKIPKGHLLNSAQREKDRGAKKKRDLVGGFSSVEGKCRREDLIRGRL